MNSAQVWTLLGIVGVFATMPLTLTMFSFNGLNALDRDVQVLTDRVFRDRP